MKSLDYNFLRALLFDYSAKGYSRNSWEVKECVAAMMYELRLQKTILACQN